MGGGCQLQQPFMQAEGTENVGYREVETSRTGSVHIAYDSYAYEQRAAPRAKYPRDSGSPVLRACLSLAIREGGASSEAGAERQHRRPHAAASCTQGQHQSRLEVLQAINSLDAETDRRPALQ